MENATPKISRSMEMTLPGEAHAVRTALERARAWLCQHGREMEDLGTGALVLAEALNNIVEHALADTPGSQVNVILAFADRGLSVRLTDTGVPMPQGELPLGRLRTEFSGIDDLPEGGFGWFLIRDLTHDLAYQREDGRNVLTFRLAVFSALLGRGSLPGASVAAATA
ncbi:MAG: ATP-binding protein [Pseudomonadota bacterium]